jgi:hypothetical protein
MNIGSEAATTASHTGTRRAELNMGLLLRAAFAVVVID